MSDPLPLLNDLFWDESASADLDPQTILRRIRKELSEGRSQPITVQEALEIGINELNYHPNLCIFAEGEIGRPLWVIGAVWGVKKLGMNLRAAKSFGCFLGEAAGGDRPGIGLGSDTWEKEAKQILHRHLGHKDSLNREETTNLLDEVIAFYKAR